MENKTSKRKRSMSKAQPREKKTNPPAVKIAPKCKCKDSAGDLLEAYSMTRRALQIQRQTNVSYLYKIGAFGLCIGLGIGIIMMITFFWEILSF